MASRDDGVESESPESTNSDSVETVSLVKGQQPSAKASRTRLARFWASRRALTVAAACVLALALLGVGFTAGWWVSGQQESNYSGPALVEVPVPQYAADSRVSMPDVRGLTQVEAQGILADAGIPSSAVAVATQEWAGTPGVIIEQSPAFGTLNPAEVKLTTSAPAAVPNVIGQPEAQAGSILAGLGTRVESARRYVAGTGAGVVVEVVPPAGSPLGESVTMVVSEAPVSIYLSQVQRIEGSCSADEVAINGTTYPDSVSCAASDKPALSEWLVNRAVDEFSGTLGVPDDGPADAQVSVRIIADGQEVASIASSYGKPMPFKVPLTGVLRLGVEVTAVNMPTTTRQSWSAALGDAKLAGSSSAIGALDGDKP